MLVLALEFSRDVAARAHLAQISGDRARTGRVAGAGAEQAHPGIAGRTARKAAPSKRKSESPTPPVGAESVPGGLPGPVGLSSRGTWEAARHPPASRRGRITSVQLGSGRSWRTDSTP